MPFRHPVVRHYVVSGHVQGVGFRRYVEMQAQNFHLSGVVRNLEDGRVELVAKGDDESLQELERAVRRGPMLSAVREVIARTLDKPDALKEDYVLSRLSAEDFAIVEDGEQPWIRDT